MYHSDQYTDYTSSNAWFARADPSYRCHSAVPVLHLHYDYLTDYVGLVTC